MVTSPKRVRMLDGFAQLPMSSPAPTQSPGAGFQAGSADLDPMAVEVPWVSSAHASISHAAQFGSRCLVACVAVCASPASGSLTWKPTPATFSTDRQNHDCSHAWQAVSWLGSDGSCIPGARACAHSCICSFGAGLGRGAFLHCNLPLGIESLHMCLTPLPACMLLSCLDDLGAAS